MRRLASQRKEIVGGPNLGQGEINKGERKRGARLDREIFFRGGRERVAEERLMKGEGHHDIARIWQKNAMEKSRVRGRREEEEERGRTF